jgi:hypothetical protein
MTRKRKGENLAFADKKSFVICLLGCLTPVLNIYIAIVAIKTTVVSLFK